jgi:hypothetical protein
MDDATVAAIQAMHVQGRLPEAQERYAEIVRRHRASNDTHTSSTPIVPFARFATEATTAV